MGDIADDVVNGACCMDCATYFVKEHGYPILCRLCWKELSPRERHNTSKATHKELGDE